MPRDPRFSINLIHFFSYFSHNFRTLLQTLRIASPYVNVWLSILYFCSSITTLSLAPATLCQSIPLFFFDSLSLFLSLFSLSLLSFFLALSLSLFLTHTRPYTPRPPGATSSTSILLLSCAAAAPSSSAACPLQHAHVVVAGRPRPVSSRAAPLRSAPPCVS